MFAAPRHLNMSVAYPAPPAPLLTLFFTAFFIITITITTITIAIIIIAITMIKITTITTPMILSDSTLTGSTHFFKSLQSAALATKCTTCD